MTKKEKFIEEVKHQLNIDLPNDKAKVFKGKIIGIDYNKITHEPQYMTNSNGTLYYLIKEFFATKEKAEAKLKELE